jgi:hypothetical protein
MIAAVAFSSCRMLSFACCVLHPEPAVLMLERTALVTERRQPADSSSARLLAGTHMSRMATDSMKTELNGSHFSKW